MNDCSITNTVDAMIERGMHAQLKHWQDRLAAGHRRVGWKIGFSDPADQRRLQLPSPVIGFLTSDRVLLPGSEYPVKSNSRTMVEAEIGIRLARDVPRCSSREYARASIRTFAPVMEIVDVSRASGDIEAILAGNVFHEAVLFGVESRHLKTLTTREITARVRANGIDVRVGEPARLPEDLAEFVCLVADTLARYGESLLAGDWIISGSITRPLEVHAGERIAVDVAPLGRVSVTVT
jgi:2-keto-4-pentenoate hydratase